MKRILITSLLVLLSANVVLAMPDYDPAQRNMKVVYVDMSYNAELYDRLYDAFIKKYTNENGSFSPPINAYAVEVLEKFNRQKKIYEY